MATLTGETKDLMVAAFQDTYTSEQLPGVSAIIVHQQAMRWAQSEGYADLVTKRPVDGDTLFHLGSITKLFTAIMLMQLHEMGKLQLDDPLERYLPELKTGNQPRITLRQLVSHTSGLPTMPPLAELLAAMQEFPPVVETLRHIMFPSIDRIIDSLSQVELVALPSQQVIYSNFGCCYISCST